MRKRKTGKLWWEDGPTGQYMEGVVFDANFGTNGTNFDANFGTDFGTNFGTTFWYEFWCEF